MTSAPRTETRRPHRWTSAMLHGGFARRALAVFAQAPRYDADAAMNAVEHAGDQEQANEKS